MGQAKQRKAEIQSLKASKTTIKFLAIRHCENGEREFAHAEASVGKPVNDKTTLLRHICVNDWLHTPPAGAIAEYLLQTDTYKMMGQFHPDAAYVINFYEVDKEYSQKTGKKTFACREIMGMTKDKLDAYAREIAEELKSSGDYSVKAYA